METWCVLCELRTEFLNIIEFNVLRRRVLGNKTKNSKLLISQTDNLQPFGICKDVSSICRCFKYISMNRSNWLEYWPFYDYKCNGYVTATVLAKRPLVIHCVIVRITTHFINQLMHTICKS
jgi:hypothetical protein